MRLAPALLAIALAACDGASGDREPLTVLAASSLAEVVSDLERELERSDPELDVVPSFAGSHVLRLQIERGAPADVFVSADEEHVEALVRAGLVDEGEVLAHNELAVIVPLDGPAGIERFEDLPRAERIVLGESGVPIGRYSRELLARAGAAFERDVLARVVSEESNARLVRAKVELGEADAAIVYRTDASERVRTIPIPEALNVRATYRAAVVRASPRRELARRFVEHARGEAGQRAFAARGFVPIR